MGLVVVPEPVAPVPVDTELGEPEGVGVSENVLEAVELVSG